MSEEFRIIAVSDLVEADKKLQNLINRKCRYISTCKIKEEEQQQQESGAGIAQHETRSGSKSGLVPVFEADLVGVGCIIICFPVERFLVADWLPRCIDGPDVASPHPTVVREH